MSPRDVRDPPVAMLRGAARLGKPVMPGHTRSEPRYRISVMDPGHGLGEDAGNASTEVLMLRLRTRKFTRRRCRPASPPMTARRLPGKGRGLRLIPGRESTIEPGTMRSVLILFRISAPAGEHRRANAPSISTPLSPAETPGIDDLPRDRAAATDAGLARWISRVAPMRPGSSGC
jgi:hypothetical protein